MGLGSKRQEEEKRQRKEKEMSTLLNTNLCQLKKNEFYVTQPIAQWAVTLCVTSGTEPKTWVAGLI